MVCLLCDFKILLTVFNQIYNYQTSHYLGRNQLLKPFLILPSLVPFVKFYWFMSKLVSNFTGRPGRPNDNGLVMCSRTLLSRIWHQKILYQSFCSFQIWNFWKVLVTLNRFEFLKIEVILHKINGFERAKSLSTTMAKIT